MGAGALKRARRFGAIARRNPLGALRLTQWQEDWIRLDAQFALLRAGNQLGKTTIMLWELAHLCRGTHPHKRRYKPPINALLLSESWEQMGRAGGLMSKFWELLPKSELDPKIRLDPGRGITGKPPRIVFADGPGKGSIVSFGTYRQGAAPHAGSTLHAVFADEPPSEQVISELYPRLLRHNGMLRIGFTPVVGMPDQRHLRKLVEAGKLAERNPWLTESNCWPVGAAKPWNSQVEIDQWAGLLTAAERDMRIQGAWDPLLENAWLTNFERSTHVRRVNAPAGAYLVVGVDHGLQAGKQTAALIAVVDRQELSPYVIVLDEEIGDAVTTPAKDAESILDMLRRNGVSWRHVDEWVGDRPAETRYTMKRKSNRLLERHLAALTGIREWPRFSTPRKGLASVAHGLHVINALLGTKDDDGTPHLTIDPRCERIAKFCELFAGNPHDPLKDAGDAMRYAVERAIRGVPAQRLVALY